MSRRIRIFCSIFLLWAGSAAAAEESDFDVVVRKLGSGLSNIGLGWLEIPKNMINSSNQYHLFVGLGLGPIKGLMHTMGRVGVGLADVLSFPVPTKPIATPVYVWQNMDVETQYGPAFIPLDRTQGQRPPPGPAPGAARY